MGNEYFEIFKHPGDHKNWSKLIQYGAIYPELNEELRARLVKVLTFFQKELGKGFLKTSGINHPIHNVISNKVVSSALWLIDFGELLIALKETDCNYDHLLKKLIPEEDCIREGIPFSWISKPYLKKGFDIKFVVENLATIGKKYADIKLTDPETGQEIIIEVSTLDESDKIKNNSRQRSLFSKILSHKPPILVCSGKQIKTVPDHLIDTYCEILENLKQKVISSNQQKSLMDQYFEITFYPEEIKEGVLYQEILGQETSYDFTDRIISSYKIHHKAKQIPKSKPGLIYLKLSPLFFLSANIERTIGVLKDYISRYINLYGLVLFGHIGMPLTESKIMFEQNGDVFRISNEPSGLICYFLFIKNSQFKVDFSTVSLEKLESIVHNTPMK